MAAEAMDKLMRERWTKCETGILIRCVAASRETDGAGRSYRTKGKCDLQLSESTKGAAIRSTLWVQIWGIVPPRLGLGG